MHGGRSGIRNPFICSVIWITMAERAKTSL